jgi:hypothetical protein
LPVRDALTIVLLVSVLFASGCAAPPTVADYFIARGRDAMDTIDLAVGISPSVFAEVQIRGFVDVPVGIRYGGEWYGLIEGRVRSCEAKIVWGVPITNIALCIMDGPLGVIITKFGDGPVSGSMDMSILFLGEGLMKITACSTERGVPWTRYLDVGAEVSVGVGLRATVSIIEAADLVLGLLCIDIAWDDEGRFRPSEEAPDTPQDDPRYPDNYTPLPREPKW